MHYSTLLRLKDADVALVEQPPKRLPSKSQGEVLREFRVPLGVNPLDAVFQVVFTVSGLKYFAMLTYRDRDTGLHHREVHQLRAIHRFHYQDNIYDVRLLSMRE